MIDYNKIENALMNEIRNIRHDYYSVNDGISSTVTEAMNSVILDFYDKNHECYEFTLSEVNKKICAMLEGIIMTLFALKGIQASVSANVKIADGLQTKRLMEFFEIYKVQPLFLIAKMEKGEPVLYWFKKYGIDKVLPDKVMYAVTSQMGINQFRYVTLVEKGAYTEGINYIENDGKDKGTNRYSFKGFFEENFGIVEYTRFKEFESRLTLKIKECLGFLIVKSLTPNALFSFKKEIEKEVKKYDYTKSLSCSKLTDLQIDSIKNQYFDKKYYKVLVSEGDFNSRFEIEGCQFAESFLTAEWLYQSIGNVGKIDLTAIAMGYFKAIEEVLFVFIAAHVDEHKWIDTYDRPDDWKNIPFKDRKWQTLVTGMNLKRKKRYIMMERMINFLSDYNDLFDNTNARDYLIERLRDAQQLRNGYFHKDNLSEMEKVEKARDDAYVIFFVLFGAMNINEKGRKILGIPTADIQYNMLCEYVNYHSSKSYYYGDNEDNLVFAIGQRDPNIQYDRNGNAKYTGLYFRQFTEYPRNKGILSLREIYTIPQVSINFSEDQVPDKIYEGSFVVCAEGFDLTENKRLIWDNGMFIEN